MLSAIEFGHSASAVTSAYGQHHPFAIAAAAAAAGTTATAAAAVVPTAQTNYNLVGQFGYHSSASASSPSLSTSPSLSSSSSLSPISPTVQNKSFLEASKVLPFNTSQLQFNSLPLPSPISSASEDHNITVSSQLNNVTAASVAVAMSSAEFARPHPKQPRYNIANSNSNSIDSSLGYIINNNNHHNNNNNNNIGNGIRSPRFKYSSEQSGPVNLVTNNNNTNHIKNNNISVNCSLSPPGKDGGPVEVNGISPNSHPSIGPHSSDIMAGIYAQKLPLPSPSAASNAATAAAVAYHMNYSHLYQRQALYGTQGLYHPLNSRAQLHGRPTYIPGQHDQFGSYLPPPPVAYSPPSVQGPPGLLGPPPPPSQQVGLNSSHTTASLLNNSQNGSNSNSSNHNNSHSGAMGTKSSLHHAMQHHIKQIISPDHPQSSQHSAKDKDGKGLAYLNGKICSTNLLPGPMQSLSGTSPSNNVAGFKVPSGKEGSLKHRFLTRPAYGDKDPRRRSPITATVVRSTNNNNASTNFTKGSLIALANGELRRVEDMRTEDFINSADNSKHLKLADSTVVKITNTPANVIITFSYNKNRSTVDMEATQEHPFFVYGKGWSSCNPELSMQTFGLACQRLQVGDICISLIPREKSTSVPSPTSPTSVVSSPFVVPQYKDDMSPQNLSRKSHSTGSITTAPTTIPTTATGIAVTSRLAAPLHLPPPQGSGHVPLQHYEIMRPYETSPPISHHHASPPAHSTIPNGICQPHPHRSQQHIMMQDGHFISRKSSSDSQQLSPPTSLSAPPSRPSSNQPYYLGTSETSSNHTATNGPDGGQLTAEQESAVDASLSRKRRWSAPDNICDDDACQPPAHKTMNNNS